MKKQFIAFLITLTLGAGALAQVTVSDAWIRATVPQAKATGAFMSLTSAQDARLVEVRSDAAGLAQIHQMDMDGQTMKMRAIAGLDLPAGKTVSLASGGYHLMLMDLKRQLKEGDTVALTLVLQKQDGKRETMALAVPVKALTYVSPRASGK